ncbi:MAG: hypothetical protein EOP06_26105, partial [Proteobacteria bacterium]
LKLEHQLVAIRSKSNGFECTFKTPFGSDVIWARQIICALPWSILKDIDGIQNLNISAGAKALIAQAKYASHSKVVASFKEPTWKKRNAGDAKSQGQFRGELAGQNYWDSSRGQAGARGVLTSQRGGARGLATGATAATETLKDLRHFFRDQSAEESAQIVNWTSKPFSKGSRHNVGPGQYIKLLEFFAEEAGSSSTFYFAGEHVSFKDFGRAEKETAFIEKYGIQPLFISDSNYPKRLLNCFDPPSMLFYMGNANVNSIRIVAVVGTRNNTEYGKSFTEKLIKSLAAKDVLVVSGLAFGIDSIAHKSSLKYGIPTIGVVGHGLDTIYPKEHTALARQMITMGGLLSEFKSNTRPDKHNFPSRNRVVAGISDATVVIESGEKGGSNIT